jgi:hypothetical protein
MEACSWPAIEENSIILGKESVLPSGISWKRAAPCRSSSPVSASFLALSSILKVVKIFFAVE